jgi:hypothetical protein
MRLQVFALSSMLTPQEVALDNAINGIVLLKRELFIAAWFAGV